MAFCRCSLAFFIYSCVLLGFLIIYLKIVFSFFIFTFIFSTKYFIFYCFFFYDFIIECCFDNLFLSLLPILVFNNSISSPTPLGIGRGGDDINLEEAKKEFSLIKDKFKFDSSVLNYNEFQLFINGFYQAEGVTGVYFPKKDSLRVVFYFSIGQNYSSEAALLFLRLRSTFGIGNIRIELTSTGKPHLKYTVSNTNDIIYKVIPYFSFTYGQKRIDLAKFPRIFHLSTIISRNKKTINVKLAS